MDTVYTIFTTGLIFCATPYSNIHTTIWFANTLPGRQRDMGDLKATVEHALWDRVRLLTLVREPDIGKSRAAQELATLAGLWGAQVL